MTLRPYGYGLAAALLFGGCDCRNTPAQRPDATVAREPDVARVQVTNAAPESLLLTLRGATLRRAVPLLFPGGGAAEVLEQLSRQVTPGVMDHGDEIDLDTPFAVAGLVGGRDDSTLHFYVAWPLRPGMQIWQDARARRGWRVVTEGIYAPTSRDAGADAEHQCWVAQRQPSGAMLLCGPTEGLASAAGYLREQANHAPDDDAVLAFDVRAALARRVLNRQLAEVDRQAPPRADAGLEALRRQAFEQARRTAQLLTHVANDAEALRGTLVQDENAMHLRMELVFNRASSETTRSLLAGSAGRQAPQALVQLLPATVRAYIVGGFDRAAMVRVFGEPSVDPAVRMQAGEELARVMSAVDTAKSLTPLGERIDAWSAEDGFTMYHVVRRPDAVQYVNDLRVAINSVPARPLPPEQGGGTLRDIAASLPTPGFTEPNALRVGRNVRIPPGVQVPPEVRAVIERSMLLVARDDLLIAVMARDPVARYRAMSQGPRLAATIPANAVMSGRVTPPAFAPLFYGGQIPGLPASTTQDAVDFAITAERRGEGGRFELRADAPINAAIEVRQIYAMIQQLQEQMMRQMLEAQQRGAQGGGGGGGGGGPMQRPMPRPQRPQLDPSMLPEPPNVQLRPPQ